MGNPGQQKIKIDNPNIIDYANSKYKMILTTYYY